MSEDRKEDDDEKDPEREWCKVLCRARTRVLSDLMESNLMSPDDPESDMNVQIVDSNQDDGILGIFSTTSLSYSYMELSFLIAGMPEDSKPTRVLLDDHHAIEVLRDECDRWLKNFDKKNEPKPC